MDDIVREGHPSLRATSKEVPIPPKQEDIDLLHDMLTFLKNGQDEEIAEKHNLRSGVGLSAPQLGIEKRLIALHYVDENDKVHTDHLIKIGRVHVLTPVTLHSPIRSSASE